MSYIKEGSLVQVNDPAGVKFIATTLIYEFVGTVIWITTTDCQIMNTDGFLWTGPKQYCRLIAKE